MTNQQALDEAVRRVMTDELRSEIFRTVISGDPTDSWLSIFGMVYFYSLRTEYQKLMKGREG